MDRRKQRVDGLMTPMSGDSKQNEWNLLKEQFDVLVRDQNVGSGSIEELLDAQFYRRVTELINRAIERNSKSGYIDWSRR